MMHSDTIAAISTPAGAGGIGVVKISGPDALETVLPLLKSRNNSSTYVSHHLYYGIVMDPQSQKTIDEVLFSIMRAPHSYTREDVVEIQAHGSQCGLHKILELVLKQGVRLAEPGEFTKRAFLNGRIDLTQAEAVAELISAQTAEGLELATRQLTGDLRDAIEAVRDPLRAILSELEVAIDFPEDVEEIVHPEDFARRLENTVAAPLTDLLTHYDEGHVYREGVSAIIIGRPNVGKSSLMNRLLRKERSIVTHIPGTTRDFIEETVNVRGVPLKLVDTAGLHDTDDALEALGIRFTKARLDQADIVLFLVDSSVPITHEDKEIYETIREKKALLLINKIDLPPAFPRDTVGDRFAGLLPVEISALTGQGIDALKEAIFSTVTEQTGPADLPGVVPNLRQKMAIEKALHACRMAVETFQEKQPPELTAIDVKEALDALGDVVGETTTEDILNDIFSRFCIGK
jgi:tRNA modification GTPase